MYLLEKMLPLDSLNHCLSVNDFYTNGQTTKQNRLKYTRKRLIQKPIMKERII